MSYNDQLLDNGKLLWAELERREQERAERKRKFVTLEITQRKRHGGPIRTTSKRIPRDVADEMIKRGEAEEAGR